jgi:hypothetical protein
VVAKTKIISTLPRFIGVYFAHIFFIFLSSSMRRQFKRSYWYCKYKDKP